MIGRRVAGVADTLITVGSRARIDCPPGSLLRHGCRPAHAVDDAPDARALLEEIMQPGDVILIKGSLGMKMDRIVTRSGEAGLMGWALTVAAATFPVVGHLGQASRSRSCGVRLGKSIRIEGPAAHAAKMGHTGHGGILIVAWTLLVSLVVKNIVQIIQALEFAQSLVIPSGSHASLLYPRRYRRLPGLRLRPGEGVRARVKIWIQLAIALVAAVLLYWVVNERHGWVAVPTVPSSGRYWPP